jgi:transposase, IS30 family
MWRQVDPVRVRAVWDGLAAGLGPMEVSRRTGVSKSQVYRWHHSVGGVYRPPAAACYSPRYLDREERYELARLDGQGLGVCAIARLMGRSPSTISRELGRNRDPRTDSYQPERAHRLAWERQRRPKPAKLAARPELRTVIQEWLREGFSPEQAAGRLRVLYPDDDSMRICHETIYQAIYVHPRGELRRELTADLRTRRSTRVRRGRTERRGGIPDPVSIRDRPEEIEGRLVPGHHEGDLIKGSIASNSAAGTIVERTTGYLTLVHLPDGYQAAKVAAAVTAQLTALPDWFARTLTWDRGREMTDHKKITAAGIQVYFADPCAPWQRGTNENTNGLIREYLPKGTDLSVHTAADLQAIQDRLNDRPRKRLGYHTPREALAKLLDEDIQRVATTTRI